MAFLSEIYLYPVKSLGGFQVQSWPLVKTGLRYDRQWMLVDENGLFLSQRRLPKMALIATQIKDQQLWLSAAGQSPIAVGLDQTNGEDIPVQVWEDDCLAVGVSEQVDQWLSEFLQHRCRLVYFPEHRVRQVDQNYAITSDQTAFSDGFPLLIVSKASLTAFNQAANLNISMQRFRPNLVIDDCAAYAEDSWRQISLGEIGLRLPKPCSRCAVPGINPDTAIAEKAVLASLAQLRQSQNKIYFGQNALHNQPGILTVGDKLTVHQSGDAII